MSSNGLTIRRQIYRNGSIKDLKEKNCCSWTESCYTESKEMEWTVHNACLFARYTSKPFSFDVFTNDRWQQIHWSVYTVLKKMMREALLIIDHCTVFYWPYHLRNSVTRRFYTQSAAVFTTCSLQDSTFGDHVGKELS